MASLLVLSLAFVALALLVSGRDYTRFNVPCRDGHSCGYHGEPYSWCYTDSNNNYDYCCINNCNYETGSGLCEYKADGRTKACTYTPLPWKQTYNGLQCRSNHVCGTYGESYSWCYTDNKNNYDYCCVNECGKFGGQSSDWCYIRTSIELFWDRWAYCTSTSIVIQQDEAVCEAADSRRKRSVPHVLEGSLPSQNFVNRHVISDNDDWQVAQGLRDSYSIQEFLRRMYRTEPNRLHRVRFHSFIFDPVGRIASMQCGRGGIDDFSGVWLYNCRVITFQRFRNGTFAVSAERSGDGRSVLCMTNFGELYHFHNIELK